MELAAARQIVDLTKDEVEAFSHALPDTKARDRLLFNVIYRCGSRRLEAALIKREHLSDGSVWITP